MGQMIFALPPCLSPPVLPPIPLSLCLPLALVLLSSHSLPSHTFSFFGHLIIVVHQLSFRASYLEYIIKVVYITYI